MAWTTPKVWTVEPIGFSSLNNIENNLKYLREENKTINGYTLFNDDVEIDGNITQTSGVTSLKATTIDGVAEIEKQNTTNSTSLATVLSNYTFRLKSKTDSATSIYFSNVTNSGQVIQSAVNSTTASNLILNPYGGAVLLGQDTSNGTDSIQAYADQDKSFAFGKGKMGYGGSGYSDQYWVGHYDSFTVFKTAMRLTDSITILNGFTDLNLRVNNNNIITLDGSEINLYKDTTIDGTLTVEDVMTYLGDQVVLKTFDFKKSLSSFSSPSSNPIGLAYDSSIGNLISCDSTADEIYIHDGISSTILSSFSSPDSNPRGLTFDSTTGNLISCSAGATIYIHDGISSTILSSFASPDGYSRGLAFDSTTGNLISCDTVGIIYIHDGISSTILSSFASPSSSPYGLTYDSSTGNLISCDSTSDTIYIHDGISSTILSSFASPSSLPYGLTYDISAGNLISCDNTSDTIYIHEATRSLTV